MPMFDQRSEGFHHTRLVRVTHWLIVIAFVALVYTGIEILISHPRFYWGEEGTVLTRPLFIIPIPASRRRVPTGYGYTLPDANGWGRYLHFQAGWLLVLAGLVYVIAGLITRHIRKDLVPSRAELTCRTIWDAAVHHFRRPGERAAETCAYNVLQKSAYLSVIFFLFPLVIWTGLAMSPAFCSAVPFVVNVLGGRQSARTIHFFVSIALLLFLILHVAMVYLAGFNARMRAMTIGHSDRKEDAS